MMSFVIKLEASSNASGQTVTKVKTASAADNMNGPLQRLMPLLCTCSSLPTSAYLLSLHVPSPPTPP